MGRLLELHSLLVTYAHLELAVLTFLGLRCFKVLCFIKVKLSIVVKLFVSLLCVLAFCLQRPSPK